MSTTVAIPPRLSVVIASFNRATFLEGCVASLRAAGVDGLEIIIVDDGSKDDTRQVVERLQPGICYIYQDNQGLSAARNTGIRAATAPYIAYLDSDDYWLPGVAPQLLAFMDRHPEIGAVFADARMGNPEDGYVSWFQAAGTERFFNLPSTEVEPGFRVLDHLPFYHLMIERNAIFTGAIIQRRELVLDTGLFDTRLKATGDWELWLRMIHKGAFAWHPESLAIYTKHENAMTCNTEYMQIAFCDTLRAHSILKPPVGTQALELVRKALRNHQFHYAYSAFDRHEFPKARRLFGELLREHGLEWQAAILWVVSALPPPMPRVLRKLRRQIKPGLSRK